MVHVQRSLEDQIETRVVVLRVWLHGIVGGLVAGALLGGATIWLLLKGGDPVGPHLSLLGEFFIGYRVTWAGSLVGFGYGFLTGFLVTAATVLLYNRLTRALGVLPVEGTE